MRTVRVDPRAHQSATPAAVQVEAPVGDDILALFGPEMAKDSLCGGKTRCGAPRFHGKRTCVVRVFRRASMSRCWPWRGRSPPCLSWRW